MRTILLTVFLASTVTSGLAHAQAKLVETDAPKTAEEKDIEGWNPFLGLTSTLSLVDNSGVVGQVEGFSTLFGLGLLGGADYVKDKSLVRTSLAVNEGFARTPVIDRFVKTNDNVKLEGLYNYFLTKKAGLYGRLSFATTILNTTDVRGTPTSWVDATGATPVPLATNAFSQKLASAFKPFTITESVGVFADPINKEELSLSFRVGAGGRHTFAEGVFVNHDDAMTPEIELLRLSDVHQFGAEAFAGASGKVDKSKANYKLGLAVLIPFVNNDAASRSTLALTRIAFEGNLTYAMNSWLSVVYSLAITRDPQLFPDGKEVLQIQNTMLLTFQMNLVKKKEKKVKTKEEQALEDAKQRADAAELRAKQAEEKLQRLEPATPTTSPDTLGPSPTPAPPPAPAPTPTTTP